MRFLLAGDWRYAIYESAVAGALDDQGHEVVQFSWQPANKDAPSPLVDLSRRAQNRFVVGPIVARVNARLVQAVRASRPDVLLLFRAAPISGRTVRAIRHESPGTIIVAYNNDDPFAPNQSRWYWRHFVGTLPHVDLALAYRHANLADYRRAGAPRVALWRSWYLPDVHRPVPVTDGERETLGSDVVFVGHFEPDGRLEALEALAEAGLRLRLFGTGWDAPLSRSRVLGGLAPVRRLEGDEYAKAIAASKVALCFLSKLNRDTYTRRCFEIPAIGTLLLAERTDDLASLFREDEEAAFFSSTDELVEQARRYVEDDGARERVAAAGRDRVIRDGHDVVARARELVRMIESLRAREAPAAEVGP